MKIKNAFFLPLLLISIVCNGQIDIVVDVDKAVLPSGSIKGKLYVLLSGNLEKEDIFYTSPIENEIILSASVELKAGQSTKINFNDLRTFPIALAKIPSGIYISAAVLDINGSQRHFAYSEGNLLSKTRTDTISSGHTQVSYHLSVRYHREQPAQTEFIKVVALKSPRLTTFYRDTVTMYAGVVLPPSYFKDSKRKFPVVYVIPEFDNSHLDAFYIQDYLTRYTEEKIYVVLNPLCNLGNHVFADSENNGPRATALVEEFIPFLEQQFRIDRSPRGRFLMGHSSGGWAAIWLQIKYPDYFGGAWATSPDPVSFRSFYRINIYDPTTNVFFSKSNVDRLFDRIPIDPRPTYKLFSDFETIVPGEQLISHESVFSQSSTNGPMTLWDRNTGVINAQTAQHWKTYDIENVLKENIKSLKGRIENKIHIFSGGQDEFYLDSPVRLLQETSLQLGLSIEIKIFEDRGHSDVFADDVLDQIDKQINAAVVKDK